MVINQHLRDLHAPFSTVVTLMESLSTKQDLLWPHERWQPMLFDRPLGVGAIGGHGEIRYVVESYEQGKYIRFRFTAPRGFIGTHTFSVEEINSGTIQLRHVINMELTGSARLLWPLAIRWLHDALLEDALDKAEAFCASRPVSFRTYSFWVRFLRYILGR